MVDITKPISEYWDENTLGGITVIKAHGKTIKILNSTTTKRSTQIHLQSLAIKR